MVSIKRSRAGFDGFGHRARTAAVASAAEVERPCSFGTFLCPPSSLASGFSSSAHRVHARRQLAPLRATSTLGIGPASQPVPAYRAGGGRLTTTRRSPTCAAAADGSVRALSAVGNRSTPQPPNVSQGRPPSPLGCRYVTCSRHASGSSVGRLSPADTQPGGQHACRSGAKRPAQGAPGRPCAKRDVATAPRRWPSSPGSRRRKRRQYRH